MIHPAQPHGSDSEQPHRFGLPLPEIPLNNCSLQSAVKNSGVFFSLFPRRSGGRRVERCTPGPRARVDAQHQHSPVGAA